MKDKPALDIPARDVPIENLGLDQDKADELAGHVNRWIINVKRWRSSSYIVEHHVEVLAGK
jgi:hypothetical protein